MKLYTFITLNVFVKYYFVTEQSSKTINSLPWLGYIGLHNINLCNTSSIRFNIIVCIIIIYYAITKAEYSS